MELWTSIRVLIRRWYVLVPCLALTAFAATQLAAEVKPTFKAEGTVVFLRPLDGADVAATPGNPWQTVDYSLNQFALLMGQAADSPAFQARVSQAGGSTTFAVTTSATQAQGSPTNQTPTLTLSVIADSPEDAMASYGILGDALDQEVRDRQQSVGAAESTWITAVDLTVPPGAVEQVGSRVTVLIAVALVGTLISLGAVFVVDALLAARRRRRQTAAVAEADDGAGEPASDAAPGPATAQDAADDQPVATAPAGNGASPVTGDAVEAAPVESAPAEMADAEPLGVEDFDIDELSEEWPDLIELGPHPPTVADRADEVGDIERAVRL